MVIRTHDWWLVLAVCASLLPPLAVAQDGVSAPSLGGTIIGKSGPPNARAWVFQLGNNGPGSALNASITSIAFVQTHGTACTPAVKTPLPLAAGNIAPHAVAAVSVTIDFSSCPASAVFKVTAAESAANGATGAIVRLNQFP